MILNYENRAQYFYFFLSGLVASALLILIYISLQTTFNDQRKDNLKILQKSLKFIKPATSWNYTNTWQPIEPTALKHQIYSAYFDFRTEVFDNVDLDVNFFLYGSIRIFAILPLRFKESITCLIREQDFTVSKIAAQTASPMQEHEDEMFSAWSIMCPLRTRRNASTVLLPLAVAISYKSVNHKRSKATYVPISYPKSLENMLLKSKPGLAICVGPLQHHYADALRLVEFVEMYRILGANHFYFYKVEVSSEVSRVLSYYNNMGLAKVLAWNTLSYDKDLPNAGSAAQINECIVRAMVVENYRYAAVVDLDEILMPLKHNSLAEFLRQCDEGRTSAFMFRNVFYHKRDGNDMFTVPPHARNRYLYTQNKVRRTVEIMPAFARSKCIVNTRSVVEMGQYQVWRAVPGFSENVMHPTVGLLFHYREKCLNCKTLLMVDYTARKYGSLIWDQVDDVCLQVFMENGGLCPTV